MKTTMKLGALAWGVMAACSAMAQSSSVTLYGSIDEYLNYMKSSSGASVRSLSDGAYMRSRIGFKGTEDLGDGLLVKFNLEQGLSADTGAQADTTRSFDRQAWVGLTAAKAGELRLGRQNTAIFTRGNNVDFTARTLGSLVNNFGLPARLDNDIAYISPKWAGVGFELHYALGEDTAGAGSKAVYQYAFDYSNGPFVANWAGIRAHAAKGAVVDKIIGYDNINLVFDYGQGKVYGAFVRTNNISSTSTSGFGNLIGPTGTLWTGASTTGTGVVAGNTTAADASRYFNVWQLSADYRVSEKLRVGALYGRIIDTSNSDMGANGGALGAYYDLSKRTMLYGLWESMSNDSKAGFRPAGSAAVSPNFTGTDVYGQRISGLQLGVLHKF